MWNVKKNDRDELIYIKEQTHTHKKQIYSYQSEGGNKLKILGLADTNYLV